MCNRGCWHMIIQGIGFTRHNLTVLVQSLALRAFYKQLTEIKGSRLNLHMLMSLSIAGAKVKLGAQINVLI